MVINFFCTRPFIFYLCFQLVLKQSLMFTCSIPYFAKHFAKYFAKYIAKYIKPYSWPKKLYQFITNLIILATITTPGRVKYHIEKHLTSSYFRSWLQRDWSGIPLGGDWGDPLHYPKKWLVPPCFPNVLPTKCPSPHKSTPNGES